MLYWLLSLANIKDLEMSEEKKGSIENHMEMSLASNKL